VWGPAWRAGRTRTTGRAWPPPPRRAGLVRGNAPELKVMHDWFDSWSGIGLAVVGMAHQSFTVSLGDHGAGRWIAVFFRGRGGYEPVAAPGTAQEPTPWRAAQMAAWETLAKGLESR
jgi:hypothetical protein